jgi:hypothetical protein
MSGVMQSTFFMRPGVLASDYVRASGTKAPTLGSGGTSWTPSGWTSLRNANADDASVAVTMAVTFTITSTAYGSCFVGSNSYITFGSGSSTFSSLSASNPALNKIHFGAADNSYQRVASRSVGTDYTRIRYEGNGSTSGTLGSPGIVAEITFFNPVKTGSVQLVELLIGNHNRTNGQFGIASSSAYYANGTGTLTANQSYVFEGNLTGTSWTLHSSAFVSGTDY